MKNKLLTKTLQAYILFSIVVVLITAPVFYLLTDHQVTHEAEEELFLRKQEFIKFNLPTFTETDIPTWNRVSRDIKIETNRIVTKDSLFTEVSPDRLDHEEVPYRVLLTPITIQGKQQTLMTRSSLIESDALIRNIVFLFLMILTPFLIGFYVITRVLSARLWKPFYSTIASLEQFELDQNTKPKLMESNVEEFERLNYSLDHLLEKNLVAFKSQKEFTENAAHELQTPIATFLAKLDVLVQEIPITKGMGEALSSLHESAARIIRLNKNLLLLSKIENDQYAYQENVSVSKILEKQSDFLNGQLEEKGVQLRIIEIQQLETKANLTLLEVAIGNLLLNALKHNIEGGQIVVRLQNKKLTIQNTGSESLARSNKLFTRFSNAGAGSGSGLGLAIVKKICDQHKWPLVYSFMENTHTFEITF